MRGISSSSDNIEVVEFLKPRNVSYNVYLRIKTFEAYLMNSGMNLGCSNISMCHAVFCSEETLHDVRNRHP